MRRQYRAIVVAPGGEFSVDFRGTPTIEGVEQKLANQGSRNFFYPFHAVVLDHDGAFIEEQAVMRQRLQSVAWPFDSFKGRTVRSFVRAIQTLTEGQIDQVISG